MNRFSESKFSETRLQAEQNAPALLARLPREPGGAEVGEEEDANGEAEGWRGIDERCDRD